MRYINKLRKDNYKYNDVFHYTNWVNASFEERLQALQDLENGYARAQGRAGCPVLAKQMDAVGEYDPNAKTISINEDVLNSNDGYLAVFAAIHEGRHAYQVHACSNPDQHGNPAETELWNKNSCNGCYYENGAEYWLQPIERDANEFASKETDEIFGHLSEDCGWNAGYDEFKQGMEYDDEVNKETARMLYGDDFLNQIDNSIHDRYAYHYGQYHQDSGTGSQALNESREHFDQGAYQAEAASTVQANRQVDTEVGIKEAEVLNEQEHRKERSRLSDQGGAGEKEKIAAQEENPAQSKEVNEHGEKNEVVNTGQDNTESAREQEDNRDSSAGRDQTQEKNSAANGQLPQKKDEDSDEDASQDEYCDWS
jgi:hypothetical protein